MQSSGEKNLKILLIGDSGVGKSSHILMFCDCTFTGNFISTIGADFKKVKKDINGQTVNLVIWDTAGQERFRAISSSYYRGAAAIIIVYDITDRQSFQLIRQGWMGQVKSKASPEVALLLVGAKSDLNEHRKVNHAEGVELANQLNIPFMQTSSKNNENVHECFITLAERCLRNANK